jgi:transcriptional repressor of dcmA and dcmR
MTDDGDLLDIKQAARFLKVSETSLRRWTNEGRLACLRVGRRRERRFRRDDLLAFMEHQPVLGPGNGGRAGVDPAGQTPIGRMRVGHGAHLCGFYTSDASAVRLASGFLSDALDTGTACVVMGGRSLHGKLRHRLRRFRRNVNAEVDAGRLLFFEYADSVPEQFAALESRLNGALRQGARAIRLVGDMANFALKVSQEELREYERGFTSRIARRFPLVTLCLYDARRFTSLDVVEALRVHPDLLDYPADRVID